MALRAVGLETNNFAVYIQTLDAIMNSESVQYTVADGDGIVLHDAIDTDYTIDRDADGAVETHFQMFKKNSDVTYQCVLIMDCTIAS